MVRVIINIQEVDALALEFEKTGYEFPGKFRIKHLIVQIFQNR